MPTFFCNFILTHRSPLSGLSFTFCSASSLLLFQTCFLFLFVCSLALSFSAFPLYSDSASLSCYCLLYHIFKSLLCEPSQMHLPSFGKAVFVSAHLVCCFHLFDGSTFPRFYASFIIYISHHFDYLKEETHSEISINSALSRKQKRRHRKRRKPNTNKNVGTELG